MPDNSHTSLLTKAQAKVSLKNKVKHCCSLQKSHLETLLTGQKTEKEEKKEEEKGKKEEEEEEEKKKKPLK